MDTAMSSVSPSFITTSSEGVASGSMAGSMPTPGMKGPTTGTAFSRPGSMGISMSMGTIRHPPVVFIAWPMCISC
jgi:hypothetical protein